MEQSHKDAISKSLKGHKTSEETRRKIGLANRGVWIKFKCRNCKKENEKREKSEKQFCNQKCYKQFVKKLPFNKQNAYRGIRKNGEPKWIYSVRYRKTHPERIAHLKARRYAQQQNAEGNHTLEEWQELKKKFNYRCAICRKKKPLTKDHIKPLSFGGTDYINNIQPLCRSCNSKKWKKLIFENPELLKVENKK